MGRFYLLGPGDMIYSAWEQEALYMTFAEKLAALRQKYGMTPQQWRKMQKSAEHPE